MVVVVERIDKLVQLGLAPKPDSCGYALGIWHPDRGTVIRFCEIGKHTLGDHKIEYNGRIYSRTGKEK